MPAFATRLVLHFREFTNKFNAHAPFSESCSALCLDKTAPLSCHATIPHQYKGIAPSLLVHPGYWGSETWQVRCYNVPRSCTVLHANREDQVWLGWPDGEYIHWCLGVGKQHHPAKTNYRKKVLGLAHPSCQTLFSSPQQLEASVNQPEQEGFWLLNRAEVL